MDKVEDGKLILAQTAMIFKLALVAIIHGGDSSVLSSVVVYGLSYVPYFSCQLIPEVNSYWFKWIGPVACVMLNNTSNSQLE